MDAQTEAILGEVHPELARRWRRFDALCEANGLRIRATCGLRPYPAQDALYQQGRTLPGKIVTNAKAGYSAHQFGYAIDGVPATGNVGPFVPDWDALDIAWKQTLMLGKQCGLSEGAEWRTFPDRPHFYLEELPATPDDNMRYLFSQGGLQGLWATWNIGAPEAT